MGFDIIAQESDSLGMGGSCCEEVFPVVLASQSRELRGIKMRR